MNQQSVNILNFDEILQEIVDFICMLIDKVVKLFY